MCDSWPHRTIRAWFILWLTRGASIDFFGWFSPVENRDAAPHTHTDHGRTHKKVTNFWYALAEIKWRFCQAKTWFLRICEIASWGFFALKSWKYKILNFKFNVLRLTFFFVLKIKRACFLNPHSFCRFFKINCSNSHIWMPWARPHNGDNLWKIPNFFVGWILSAIISGFSRARG